VSEMASSAKEQAQHVASQAGEKAHEGAQQVREQARTAVRSQLDVRSTQAGEQASSLASTIRTAGGQLRDQGNARQADVAEQAARQVERLGAYLSDTSADRMLDDVERFARRRPWVIGALGFVGGLAGSRLLNASSEWRYSRSMQTIDYAPVPTRGYDLGSGYPPPGSRDVPGVSPVAVQTLADEPGRPGA
jgi:hypothetical protein